MQIEFDKKQYETLLKLVYLGNWMANATRVDNKLENYENMEDYIFSFARKFGFPEYVDNEEINKGKFFPTRLFEEGTEVSDLIEEYDNEAFWDELSERLGDRDFMREYGEEKIRQMDDKDRFILNYKYIDKWAGELEKNGIDRLEIKK